MVASQGGRQVLAGLIAGAAIGLGLTRGFAAAVEGAPAGDIQVLMVIIAGVAVMATAAMAIPTRRAVTIQIVRALLHE